MEKLHRIAAAASWAVCSTMAAWAFLVWASLTIGLPSGLAEAAMWLRSTEPMWLWSADRFMIWYGLLCAGSLSLWLGCRRADRRGIYLRGGFWLAVLNPFWPWPVLNALEWLVLWRSHQPL